MTEEEALEALRFHSGRHENIHSTRWEDGFLSSLRPYRGELNARAMSELVECLRVLAPRLQRGDTVERELITDFLYVIGAGQHWGLHPEGAVQRDKRMTTADACTLRAWFSEYSLAFAMLVEGIDLETALGMIETKVD
ncbi:MAG: hypothetical protein KC800_09500 [Candidatus Eremiobacteraeota bacterium]|nr:hypothetical protein [Candidatus Eremiobacteraeota bacterium]